MSSNQSLHYRITESRKSSEKDENPGRQTNLFHGTSSESVPFQSVSTNRIKGPPKSSMAKRLGNLFSAKAYKGGNDHGEASSMAVLGDNATILSGDGQQSVEGASVAPTVHSQMTVKASNKPGKVEEKAKPKKPTKPWKKFKEFVGVKSTKTEKLAPTGVSTQQKNADLDVAIRGRMDGVDSLSLGPANLSSFPSRFDDGVITFSSPSFQESPGKDAALPSIDFDPLMLSFTTLSKSWNPSDIVADSIWSAGGMSQSEMVLEGFANERWTLRFNDIPSTPTSASTDSSSYVPRLQSIDDDDESSTVTDNTDFPLKGLWHQLWGNNSPTAADKADQEMAHDDLLEIAAACSVPVDLDEGTFIIDSPEHFRSVHELVTIPLQVFFKTCGSNCWINVYFKLTIPFLAILGSTIR